MSVEPIVEALRGRGVVSGRLLTSPELRAIESLEEEYSRRRTPLGRPVNIGVTHCIRKRYVCALATSPCFRWPEQPYAVIKVGHRVVGYMDRSGVHVHGNLRGLPRGESTVLYIPVRLPELDAVARGHLAAFPSPPSHSYLARILGLGDGDWGTLLVGFEDVLGR